MRLNDPCCREASLRTFLVAPLPCTSSWLVRDVAVVGLADVAHRPEVVGRMLGLGGILVASAYQVMDDETPVSTPQ